MSEVDRGAQSIIAYECSDFVKVCENRPVLFAYQVDGNPILTKSTHIARCADSSVVIRTAGVAVEYPVERCFIKSMDGLGRPTLPFISSDPRPLTSGTSSWYLFSSAINFFLHPLLLWHSGPIVWHFAFDRPVYSAVLRKIRQHHAHVYEETQVV